MMNIQVVSGTSETVSKAISQAAAGSFVSIHCNCDTDITPLQAAGAAHALHGATSCLGAMTHMGPTGDVAAFILSDADGDYGTAMEPVGDDPFAAARSAVLSALDAAGRAGELPDMIWLSCAPGAEEDVVSGIEAITGTDVPIIGGSAADNSVEGNWFVFDMQARHANAVIVSVLFPSRPVSFAYQNGYAPTGKTGTVTKCKDRTILEIDGRPAMQVYSEWTDGAVTIEPDAATTKAILSDSTLFPFGREVSEVGGVPYYLLAHPAGARANGEMDLFASLSEGEVLTQMSGTIDGLCSRAGRVADLAMAAGQMHPTDIKGALMIYCGGCMLTVRDRIDDVVGGVNSALKGAPFLGAFTFGEQGAIVGSGNRHGNLMISCIIFG